jgi:hypothetical protein
MSNICSCSTIVVLSTNEVIFIRNYCSAIKSIKNMETQSIGIKSLSGTCDVKVSDRLGKITILSLDEGAFRFFSDILSISCGSNLLWKNGKPKSLFLGNPTTPHVYFHNAIPTLNGGRKTHFLRG